MRYGDWLLLDEINLASDESLACVHAVIDASLCADEDERVFYENANAQPVKIHSNFRLFACMNPATDSGKRNVTQSIRNR
jgi:midasin